MNNFSKKMFLFFIFMLLHMEGIAAPKSLSCSKNGTVIYYFDGDLPLLSEGEENLEKLVISMEQLKLREKIDSKLDVEISGLNITNTLILKKIFDLVVQQIKDQNKKYDEDFLAETVSDFFSTIQSIVEKILLFAILLKANFQP